ncbi:MAG: Gfo/Idh/MocA family oxidoreductase [Lentisphaeria bacterium]|nr:Gfo/Idh/MocA family oxidoreductase [Lentisphaeria bacterium]
MEKVRYAVVGLRHGREHVEAIMNDPRAELVMCCDLEEERFRSLELPSGVDFTTDMQQIAIRADLDAVVISLPTHLHTDSSVMMLSSGKHVLCEKPLAPTLEEGLRIKEAVEKSGKIFQLGYEVRYSPFHQKILEICRNGSIGTVTNVWWNMFCNVQNRGWRLDRKKRGGKIFDCGCHYYNLLENWAGAPAKRICAFGNLLGKTGPTADQIPESATIMFEYENGVRGVFTFSEKCPNLQNSTCGVAGTGGKIEADPYYPDECGSMDIHANGGQFQYHIDIKNTGPLKALHLGFREQHTAFMDSILHGKEVYVDVNDGLRVIRILDAIDESLTTGQVVTL